MKLIAWAEFRERIPVRCIAQKGAIIGQSGAQNTLFLSVGNVSSGAKTDIAEHNHYIQCLKSYFKDHPNTLIVFQPINGISEPFFTDTGRGLGRFNYTDPLTPGYDSPTIDFDQYIATSQYRPSGRRIGMPSNRWRFPKWEY